MRTYIKNLQPNDLFVMVPNTVYRAIRVHTEGGLTEVTYTVEGSHFREATRFIRASLSTCELIKD